MGTGVLKRLAIVALLAFVGLMVGVAVTDFGPPSYIVGEEFVLLPAHSNGPARDLRASLLAAVARSQHVQGVRIRVLNGNGLQIIGHGSLYGAARAFHEVAAQVRKAVDQMPGVKVQGIPFSHALARPQGNAAQTGAIGLLAGLGAGLGLVYPKRDRDRG